MLINPVFFQGELNIVGWNNIPPVHSALCSLIEQREPEYLGKAMGYTFRELFIEGIQDGIPRFLSIRDGGIYRDCRNNDQVWNGLAKARSKSPIAAYCYYFFQRETITQSTTLNEVRTNTDKSSPATVNYKATQAFNFCVEETRILWQFLLSKDANGIRIYPEFNMDQVRIYSFNKINVLGI